MDEECVVDNRTENDNSIEINNELDSSALNQFDFSCEFTENIPKILQSLNISLAFTSYQAGRLMLIRSDGNDLDVNYKSFPRPMGLTASADGLTLGIFTQVINFKRVDSLVEKLKETLSPIEDDITAPRIHLKDEPSVKTGEPLVKNDRSEHEAAEPEESDAERDMRLTREENMRQHQEKQFAPVDERVDACFIARSSHYTGMINLHDIAWGDEGLWVVNSSFSCLCTLEPDFSFVPRWQPHFISELVPEDRCHLNGMALKDGKPAYVTTFSQYDTAGMWRKGEKFNGTLMDVETNKILLNDLTMPHSPRWYQDSVYYCNSGLGLLNRYDPKSNKDETLTELQGFTRGMDFYGPIIFVGLSKVRRGNVLGSVPLANKYEETFSGIWLIDKTSGKEIGHIKFTGNVDQIYDVAVVPECNFPEMLEPSHPRMRNHFCVP